MNRKAAILIVLVILGIYIAEAVTSNYTTYVGRAIKIGDGKWIDLNGQGIGSSTGIGYAENITCLSNCINFNGSSNAGNASYPINLSNVSQATRIFSENTSNLTVTYLSNGNVSINALAVKGDAGATGGGGNASYPINLSNASQATQIFSANTSNLTVTYLTNGNVSLNAITIKGDTGATGGGFTTQNATGCILNTVYQNTNSNARVVSAILLTNGAISIDFLTDVANPPTTSVWTLPSSASAVYSVYGIVLPNNYFKIATSGSPTLYSCAAWN